MLGENKKGTTEHELTIHYKKYQALLISELMKNKQNGDEEVLDDSRNEHGVESTKEKKKKTTFLKKA